MNQDILQGKWKQFKGDMLKKWGRLTDDDLDEIDGNRQKFLGKIQEQYGIARNEAEKQLEEWEKSKAA